MFRPLRIALAALACLGFDAAAQVVDLNLQNLLSGLMQGTEVTLLTPVGNGLVQVTSFTPPQRLSAVDAAGVVERARQHLAALGVTQPSGEQLAVALIGGTVDVPTGRTQLPRVLPGSGVIPAPRSQLIFSSALPQVVAPPQGSAVSGATAPPTGAAPGTSIVPPPTVPGPMVAPQPNVRPTVPAR